MKYIPDFVEPGALWCWAAAGFVVMLAVAALQDFRICEVTNGIWLLAGICWLVPACIAPPLGSVWEPLLFLVWQQLFFSRFYGRADCHAFSCCGFYLWGLGGGLEVYLLHMLLSLLLLGICQLFKGNVNIHGNLHTPVPFLPYVFLGFCGVLAWNWT